MMQVRTLVVAVLAATVAVATIAPPAAAATSCVYDPGARRVTITVEQNGSALLYVLGDRIHGGQGYRCGKATRANTNLVKVVGTSAGSESVSIDLYNGRLAPGFDDEGDGLDEIEIRVDLKGTPSDFTRETLMITGMPGRDRMTLGTDGVSLNGDDDVDVTFTGDMSSYPGKQDVTLAGGLGGDKISAQGGYGSGAAATGYHRLSIYGNDEANQWADSPNTIRGGNGPDEIVAGDYTPNRIYGHDGDDVIFGGVEADVLYGMHGNDHLWGDNGDDKLFAGPGDDSLTGGDNADVLYGHEGQDDLDLSGDDYYVGDPAVRNEDLGDCGGGDRDEVLIDLNYDQIVGCETIREDY